MRLAKGRRLEWANWTTSVMHLGLLGIASESESRTVWAFCLMLIGAISLFAWTGNVRRWRAITDTATSRIASAAQGYAEIVGKAEQPAGQLMWSRLRNLPCVWFWFRIERKGNKDRWITEEEGESDAPFLINDGSGRCMVYPSQAEVHGEHREVWQESGRRYTEITIVPGDQVYAIGEFATARPLDPRAEIEAAVGELLVQWKSDPQNLREQFDLDRNGELDLQEWALARAQARREVERTRANTPPAAPLNTLRKPRDNRLYMVSNMDPVKLARKYLTWKWVHLMLFLGGVCGGTALLVL
jgi:hypothetical protein